MASCTQVLRFQYKYAHSLPNRILASKPSHYLTPEGAIQTSNLDRMPGNSGVERNMSTSDFHGASRKITSGLAAMELLDGAISVAKITRCSTMSCKLLFISNIHIGNTFYTR